MAYTRSKKNKKKQEKKRKLIIIFSILLFLICVGFVFLMRTEHIQISTVEITGNGFVQEVSLRNVVEKNLYGDSLLFIPKTNILFLQNNRIENEILEGFMEVEDVSVNRSGLKSIEVLVTERLDEYVLCQEGSCFSFDESSFIFMESVRSIEEIPYYFSSTKTYSIGDNFLNAGTILEISILIDSLEKKGLDIVEVHEYTDFTYVLKTKKGTKILVPAQDAYDDIYSILVKLFNTEDFLLDKDAEDFRKDFAYINVQFGKKIFSCLVGEECEINYQ